MKIAISICLLLLNISINHATFDGDSFEGSLEETIDSSPCVRLFTSNGDIGCRTPDSKGVGVLYEIRNEQDIVDIDQIDMDFSIVTPAKYFNQQLIAALAKHNPEGVIVYDDEWIPSEDDVKFSTDVNTTQGAGTPQQSYTYNNEYPWNSYGNGIMYKSLPYAVVLAEETEMPKLLSLCKENRKYGLSANRVNVAEFKYYMGKAGMTSKECLAWTDTYGHRSPQCLPIGGLSVWATAGVLDARDKVLVTAGIDSTAFFHYLAYGGNDAAATIAVMMATADAIGRSANIGDLEKQPLFFLANAEEFGYAGSRRFARDITTGIGCSGQVSAENSSSGLPLCTDPIYPSTLFEHISETTISDVIGVDQVGRLTNGALYLHSLSANDPSNMDIFEQAVEDLEEVSVTSSAAMKSVPPSPMNSFMKAISDLENTGVVFSGYDTSFEDPTFHTRFDKDVSSDDVISAATVLSRAVYMISGGDAENVAAVNTTYAKELLECLTSDWLCLLMSNYAYSELNNMAEYLGGSVSMKRGSVPPNYYPGVLEPSSGGLPVIQHGAYVYGRYEMDEDTSWDKDHDKIYNVPSVLEAFIRNSLGYSLGGGNSVVNAEGEESTVCSTSSECGTCTILDYVEIVREECITGKCLCPTAFFHLALDPGIAPETNPYHFEVVDEDAVSYTEPYWKNIGVRVYPTAGNGISVTALVVGLTVSVLSVAGVLYARDFMVKLKVF